MSSVLVTGANRGLGVEFVRQYAHAGWRVFACCRKPEEATELRGLVTARVTLHALDVREHGQIEALAAQLKDEPIDILLNNAGIYGPSKMFLGQLDYGAWMEVLRVNTFAPIKMAECFLENVARSDRKVIAAITSTMGSITRNHDGRHYLYRTSKAALNMGFKSLSIDVQARGILVAVCCPGWVQTDMGGPDATLTPAQSVAGVKRLLDHLKPQDTGKFFYYDGAETPW